VTAPAISNRPGGRPRRILLRSPKDPFEVVSPSSVLERNLVGGNAGNLVFLQATWKILGVPGVTIAPDRLETNPRAAGEINERYDAYVIPLANAFRPSFESTLIQMTELIKRLRIPVIILGVGAQASVGYELGRLKPIEPAVRAFVSAVLDRGPSIGVRGELTHSYLRSLGFRDVEVIGCPSMFLHGEDLRVEKRLPRLERDARVSLNVSPYVKAMGSIVTSHVERYPNLTYVAQDLDTLCLLLWGESPSAAAETNPIPIHLSHPLFRENRVRFYVEPWPWIADLRGCDFAFGTRIHGNITALLAGTPAYVFAHDSRTLELVRYFGIPHRAMSQVPPDVTASDLYDEADYGELNRGHAARFATFRAYLERHGLGDVFTEGDAGRSFDERIARTAFPPGVGVSAAATEPGSLRARAGRARYGLHRALRGPSIRNTRRSVLRRLARLSGESSSRGGGPAEEDRD
jgi:hypothetical protein